MPFQLTPLTVAIALIMGTLSATIAHRRGRNGYLWFFVGFLFGLIGMLAVFFMAPKKAVVKPILSAPAPQVTGPSDKFWYYLDPAHAQQGPMSFEALTKAFGQGKISPSTFVWHEDLSDWKPLQEFLKA